MNIAIQNIHELPNLFSTGLQDYAINLLRNGTVKYLYFDIHPNRSIPRFIKNLLANRTNPKFNGIPWANIEFILSKKTLYSKCDVLLNFNTHLGELQFTDALRHFDGLKIFHVTDYFWNNPGSEINKLLVNFGVEHLFGYASHDRYCRFFNKTFPQFKGKVWGVPFGFAPRFKPNLDFGKRINKVVALGSVNPIRDLTASIRNYKEPGDFFADEVWMHKFRRLLVLNKSDLTHCMDSMLPEYPQIKDFRYDLVDKFNHYKMFSACESIYFFPPAKYFEGSACGSVCVCANHLCNIDYGFKDGENCVMYESNNIENFKEKVEYYQRNTNKLDAISNNAMCFANNYFSHKAVAEIVAYYIGIIYSNPRAIAAPLKDCFSEIAKSSLL